MIDNFLPIPDAEYLPLYRVVLKLACVKMWHRICEVPLSFKSLYARYAVKLSDSTCTKPAQDLARWQQAVRQQQVDMVPLTQMTLALGATGSDGGTRMMPTDSGATLEDGERCEKAV